MRPLVLSCLVLGAIAGCQSEVARSEATYVQATTAATPADQEKALRQVVDAHDASPRTEVQDTVTRARMRLGYMKADRSRWQEAGREFEQAAAKHRGSSHGGGGFASLERQAEYQAVVCLEAQAMESGDPVQLGQAVDKYQAMLRDDPESQLVVALARRLNRLAPERRPEWDALLQKAVSHQERQARLSAAACGPKAVEHLIRALGGTSPGLDALAKIGEQGFDGTSVTGVRRMLEAGGVESKGMYLNRKDFSRLTGKHLWLREGHFVVVERARNRDVVVYDPQDGSTKPVALPPLDDPNFLATVVVVSQSPLPTQPQKS